MIPKNESLWESLSLLTRLIGTDSEQGKTEMREIVTRVGNDAALMLSALEEAEKYIAHHENALAGNEHASELTIIRKAIAAAKGH